MNEIITLIMHTAAVIPWHMWNEWVQDFCHRHYCLRSLRSFYYSDIACRLISIKRVWHVVKHSTLPFANHVSIVVMNSYVMEPPTALTFPHFYSCDTI